MIQVLCRTQVKRYFSLEKAKIELALSDQEKLDLHKRNLYLEDQQTLKMEEMYVCSLIMRLLTKLWHPVFWLIPVMKSC